jgi:hypothetical protein
MKPPVDGYSSRLPPFPFLISKTESIDAITMNSSMSTKNLPGQIRFPAPNANVTVGSSRKLPSALMNRSGINTSGSGYAVESCKIPLKINEPTSKIWCGYCTMRSELQSPLNTHDESPLKQTCEIRLTTFRYKVTLVHVILRRCVRYTCGPKFSLNV